MKSLKEKLKQQQTVYGSWITLAHPSIPEIMADAGFDFLVVDMEHSSIDLSQAQTLIQAIEAKGVTPLVRIGEHDPNLIKRVMDAGAHGIIAAMVNTAEEAEAIVQSVYYPPAGTRGVGLARAQKYGTGFEAYKKWSKENSIVMAIIENRKAIENLEEILSVDGLDATMIGPYDLSGSMGHPGEFDRPEVKKAIAYYEKTCKKMKKTMGFHIVQPEPARVRDYKKRGFRFLAIGLDTLYLSLHCREVLKKTGARS